MDPELLYLAMTLSSFYAVYATINIHSESKPRIAIAVYLAVTALLWLTIPVLVLAMVHRHSLSLDGSIIGATAFAAVVGVASAALASYRAYRIFKEARRRSGCDPWGFN